MQSLILHIKKVGTFSKKNPSWQLSLLTFLGMAFPICFYYYYSALSKGSIAVYAGLMILYTPHSHLRHRFKSLLTHFFVLILGVCLGLCFRIDYILSSVLLGIYAVVIDKWSQRACVDGTPGNFFFIMVAMIVASLPLRTQDIPIQLASLVVNSCVCMVITLLYSLHVTSVYPDKHILPLQYSKQGSHLSLSIILGVFICVSLLLGHYLSRTFSLADKPYWLSISVLSLMQNVDTKTYPWVRMTQRILGTLTGICLVSVFFHFAPSAFTILLVLLCCLFVFNVFGPMNYFLLVTFTTQFVIWMLDLGALHPNLTSLMTTRFVMTLIGCAVGMLGYWCMKRLKEKNAFC